MSTSLAEQLQRLAVPQTSVLKHTKKRASLLFDPKEAASLKRETVYQIGLEGLDELIQKNDSFEEFSNTLFHFTSKDFERSVQNNDINKKLDKNIKKFLLLLSPHFLLSCSHKALEWLIHRYAIQEYNREDILKLILPYHETNIFVRMLQLLKFKDAKDSFYFLKGLQKSGVHLPKQSLLNHAATNNGFLKFVTEFIMQLLKIHDKPHMLTVAFNFYCNIFIGALEYSENINDDQVSQMLPLLLRGLNSIIADFCAASYVITARLVTKITLSEKILNKFAEKISDLKVSGLKTESCLLLIVLYQSSAHYLDLPSTAVVNLSKAEWLPKILQNLNESGCHIYSFLKILIKRCSEEGIINNIKLARELVQNCLNEIKLDHIFIPTFLHSILEVLQPKMKYSNEAKEWLVEIIQNLERQYPSAFDKEVYKILSINLDNNSNKQKKCLSKILKNTMAYKEKFDVFEKLYHPNPEIRGRAVKFLKDNYTSLRDSDKEMIKGSLVDRLYDENINVVNDTLGVVKKTNLVEQDSLKKVLIVLLLKYHKDPIQWRLILKQITGMLLATVENDWEIFLAIFPLLIPNSSDELEIAKNVCKTDFIKNYPLFQQNIEKLHSASDANIFSTLLFKILYTNSNNELVNSLLLFLQDRFTDKYNVYYKYASFLILSNMLQKNSSLEVGTAILEISTIWNLSKPNIKFDEEESISNGIKLTFNGKYPVQSYVKSLQNIIQKIKKPEWNIQFRDFSIDNAENKFFLYISKVLFGQKNFESHLQMFLKYFCPNLDIKIDFILNLCNSENVLLDNKFKEQALNYVSKILTKVSPEDSKQHIYLENHTAVLLMILLTDSNTTIRKVVLEIIKYYTDNATRKASSYYYLLEDLEKHEQEIIMDNEQTPLIVFNTIDPSNTKGKKQCNHLNSIRNQMVKLSCKDESLIYLKSGILKLLSYINIYENLEQMSKLALDILEQKPKEVKSFQARIIENIARRIESKVIKKMNIDSDIWKFIDHCIKNDDTLILMDECNKISPSALVLNQLNADIFDVLEDDVSRNLLDIIIEISSISQNPEISPAANRLFKHINLDATFVLDQLIQMRDVQSPRKDPKRKRASILPTVDILDTTEWKKGICILEFIQDKKKIKNFNSLLQVLFDILKRCLDFDEQASVEYPKQLVLSSILHCCTKSEGSLPANVFNIELIVQCIRASQNPQTHHHALLVLAHTAHLIPDQVLHRMMAIFTFMGSSVLRHDDAYSFQIITKIIDTIIPILVKDNQEADIAKILRVFVDVLLDVPEHRKMPLYKQLLDRINAKENLYIFLLLVFESQVLHSTQHKQDKENGQKKLEIAANLSRQFSPSIVIYNCVKLLKYLHTLPDEKDEDMDVDENNLNDSLSITTHTPKDFRHFKYLILKFTGGLLGSPEFINQVAILNEEQELGLEELFKELIINVLQCIQKISKISDQATNTPQVHHYWKVVLHLSYDILDSVNALVTAQMFLLITKGLLVHNLPTVRRRILELLNNKLQFNSKFFEESDKTDMYALIPPILSIIGDLNEEIEQEQETIIQTALLSLKLLVKNLAHDNSEKFVQILEFLTKIINSGKAKNNVLASLLLCLAEFCANLKAHAISSLPDFMPAIIKILKQQRKEEIPTVLLRSALTTVERIFDSLPLFLSPYLQKLLFELSILISKWGLASEDQKVQPFLNKINSIKQKIGYVLPLRILLPSVEQCYNSLVEKKCSSAVSSLMDILGENLSNLTGIDIANGLPDLTTFFLNALQFRTECQSSGQADEVESHIVKALTILILKLSESSFRPLYYKLYAWAVQNEEKNERIITFYNLSSTIAQSLKGLFVLFAGHFINNAAYILNACNKEKNNELYFNEEEKNILLLQHVLKTLDSIFLYDTQKFINKDRFDILMQPLVDQLDNTLGGIDNLTKRNSELLTPCIVHFAQATADDALWKQMNYQILLKVRHSLSKIRLIALHCLAETVKKLGEDFLPLLPETIPFLAELLEDEDEDVEKACQKAIQEMEKVLGEPLQKYF